MKNHRSILCALLAIAMVVSFGSCTGTAGKGGVEEPAPPETARAEPAPSGTAPEEPPAAVTEPSDPPEDWPDLVILSREEYAVRPHGIQEGTVFSFGIVGALSPYGALPWNVTPAGWLTGSVFEGLLYMYMNDPGLYQAMLDEYDAMSAASTWDDMLSHCRQITKYVQDDFGAIGGVQAPTFPSKGKAATHRHTKGLSAWPTAPLSNT